MSRYAPPPLILPGIVTASWFGSFRCRPHCSLTLHPVLANLYTRPSLLASTAHSHSTANLVHTHPSCSAASSLTKICPTWTRRFRCVVPRSASRGPLVKMAPAGLSFNFFGTGLTADASQTGTVHCDNSPQPTLFTYLWVALLVFEHFTITILLPVLGALWLRKVAWPKMDKSSKDKGATAGPYWPALLDAALPVLAVGCFGEIAGHIFDNWLYLGLVPNYYLAVFYTGLTLGTGMLALGIWKCKPSKIVQFGLPASALAVFAFISGAYTHCNGVAKAAASAKNGTPSAAFEGCVTNPVLLIVVFVVTFGAIPCPCIRTLPAPYKHTMTLGAHMYLVPCPPVPQELLAFGRWPSSL